ncbi:MAG: AAA family ATPase [Deltaproteobacteria bacterium]|nr:AAA family ATPase [Deltaproteobacteria bacterium]
MKILNVRFKNINTLKGEWEIHFDRSPLKESGLFAITGPNGSGKTTIFDAISLGIYGETARLKNSPEQIMSKQTSRCFSMVTFSVNGNVYRSTWSLRSAQGKTLPPKMKLFEMNGKERLLEDKISTVRNRIAVLTGLDFKRFSRSIMLVQGEFSAFLNALDNERAEILDKIVGKDIFSEVSKAAVENAEAAVKKLQALEEEIQDFPLMHTSEIENLKESVEQLEEDFNEADKLILILNENEDRRKRHDKFQKKYQENQIAIEEARHRKSQMESDFQRLKKAMAAAPFQEEMDRLDSRKSEASKHLDALKGFEREIADLEDRHNGLKEMQGMYALELDQGQKAWFQRRELVEKTLEIDGEIAAATDSVGKLLERQATVEEEQAKMSQEQQAVDQEIAENETRQKDTERWLEEHPEYEELVERIPVIKDGLEQLQSIRQIISAHPGQRKSAVKAESKAAALLTKTARKIEKLRNKAEKVKARKAAQNKTLTALLGNGTLKELEKIYGRQKDRLKNYRSMHTIAKVYVKKKAGNRDALEKVLIKAEEEHAEVLKIFELENNRLSVIKNTARFEPCRKQLKEKDSCPLCGSQDHPHVTAGPSFGTETVEAFQAQENTLKKIQNRLKTLSNHIAELKEQYDSLVEMQKEWNLLCQATGAEWAVGDRHSVKTSIRALKKDMRRQGARLKKIRKHHKKTGKIDQAIQKHSVKLTEKQTVSDKLQTDLNIRRNSLSSLQQETQNFRKTEAEVLRNLQPHLEMFKEKIPEPGTENELNRQLEARRVEFLDHLKTQNELKEQAIGLKNRSEALPQQLDRLKTEADDLGGRIKTRQGALNAIENEKQMTFGTGDPIQEKRETEKKIQTEKEAVETIQQQTQQVQHALTEKLQLKQVAEKKYRDIQKACEDLEQNLLNLAVASGFTSLADAQNSRLRLEERQTLEHQQEAIDCEIGDYAANLDAIQKDFDEHGITEAAVEFPEDLSLQIQGKGRLKDELSEALTAALDRLEHQKTMEKEYELKLREIEEQKKMCDRLHDEKEFFESAGEADIKNRTQELVLERLLEHSNRQLEELSGRYRLRRCEENGLGLEIEDVFHQRERRSTQTLSGGETFLVSLAMALGLSDIAGNGRKIESLFVDEGFGYLDDETLYKVVSTLKNLKRNGKLVGVISHVKRLEDEIPTKIRINKVAGGVSRLEVVA